MIIRKPPAFILSLGMSTLIGAAEPADEFSRANCFNNESITYNYWDPPEWRGVYSWHYQLGVKKHYVTENPPDIMTCYAGGAGNHMVSGLYCLHYMTLATRHAAVHGAFASSEPNPDGTMVPGFSTDWYVEGVHAVWYPGFGGFNVYTSASDCNLRFEQFY